MKFSKKAGSSVLLATLIAVSLSACGGEKEVEKAAPVELTIEGAPSKPVKVGVLWSRTSNSGQGSEWRLNASGASVAEYRLNTLGKTKVKLLPFDDGGEAAQAVKGVKSFVKQGASGIVVASSGSHLNGAIATAARAGMPVLLPYYPYAGPVTSGVWLTGPTVAQDKQALKAAVTAAHIDHAAIINGQGKGRDGFGFSSKITYTQTQLEDDQARKALKKQFDDSKIDGFIIDASVGATANLVATVESIAPSLPIVITPEATSVGFADQLDQVGGAVTSNLLTAGTNSGDTAALASTTQGASASAFLTAVRLAAGAKSATSLGGSAFSGAAPFADSASHDAVIALVAAAANAKSADHAKVSSALGRLTLDATDGIAGPTLDFRARAAVANADVVPLRASTQDPGLRPKAADNLNFQRLYWFDASETETE